MVVITTICLSSWNLRRTPIIVSLLAYMEETRSHAWNRDFDGFFDAAKSSLGAAKSSHDAAKSSLGAAKALWRCQILSCAVKSSHDATKALMMLQKFSRLFEPGSQGFSMYAYWYTSLDLTFLASTFQ